MRGALKLSLKSVDVRKCVTKQWYSTCKKGRQDVNVMADGRQYSFARKLSSCRLTRLMKQYVAATSLMIVRRSLQEKRVLC